MISKQPQLVQFMAPTLITAPSYWCGSNYMQSYTLMTREQVNDIYGVTVESNNN